MWEVGKEDGDGFPSPFARVAGSSRERRREGWVPAPRLHGGRIFAGITEGGMGPRPPSSRGQDLDARTRRGRAARFLDCARNDMWVVGMGSRPRFHGGQALRGNNGVVRWNNGWVGGMGGSRTAPTGENVVGHGVHPHPPFSRGQALRGNNGGRDGSPPPVFTGAGSRREDKEGEGGSRTAPTDWVMGSLYFRW